MSDLEWYLDVGGKQSGPHSAREIVEMVRGGKIPATAQVTAARMSGDWVTAQDLIDAYDELYTKPKIAVPVPESSSGPAFTVGPADPNFTAPPRPTDALEKSKIITLNREDLDRTPDPTDALFQAIQAVREKANQKTGASAASASAAPATRDTFGQLSRPGGSRLQPLILIGTFAAIFAVLIYGMTKLIGGKKAEEAARTPVAAKRVSENTEPPAPPTPSGGLLNDRGGGRSAARTTPPVQPRAAVPNRGMNPMGGAARRETRDDRDRDRVNPMGGGARYRDERDGPLNEDAEVDESDLDQNSPEQLPEPMPIDPSQVPSDRIIPEPGTYPGRPNGNNEYPDQGGSPQ